MVETLKAMDKRGIDPEKKQIQGCLKELKELQEEGKLDEGTKMWAAYAVIELLDLDYQFDKVVEHSDKFLEVYPKSKYAAIVRMYRYGACMAGGKSERLALPQGMMRSGLPPGIKYTGSAVLMTFQKMEEEGRVETALEIGNRYMKLCKKAFDKALREGKMRERDQKLWKQIQEKVAALEKLDKIEAAKKK